MFSIVWPVNTTRRVLRILQLTLGVMSSAFRSIISAGLLITCVGFFYLGGCQQPGDQTIAPVPRDTTVTIQNSYSKIFIDSQRVEKFILTEDIHGAAAQRIRNFYNKRNYSYAWFTDTGFTVQAQAFWSVHDDQLRYTGDSSFFHDRLHAVMDAMLNEDSVHLSPDTVALTEMRLTAHFFEFGKQVYGNRMNPEQVQWNIPARQLKLEDLLDSLLATKGPEWRPLNRFFNRMQQAILKYREYSRHWDSLPLPPKILKKGDRHQLIRLLKQRMQLLQYSHGVDNSDLYDDSLELNIAKLRTSYGLKDAEQIDAPLIKALNVSPKERLKQMLINLERFKWLPDEPSRYIFVNIPDYSLYVMENSKPVLNMRVVVGKAVNRTVIFSGDLKYVVFNPYWNVPASIVRNELLPEIIKSSTYLSRNNMEVTGYAEGLPVIRQRPGPDNPLGRIKFLFPNEYNIYLHDTNAKTLFEQSERAFSHGCIRVQKPLELAEYLLVEDTAWTQTRIAEMTNVKRESWVTLRKPVKVFVLYITSWVDREGYVNFRKDIYGHDSRMSKVLFSE
jgi:murein L,D-transpeptidase YcbB/YkuD